MIEIIGDVDYIVVGKIERLSLDEVKAKVKEQADGTDLSIIEFKDDTFKRDGDLYYIHADTNKGPAWFRIKDETEKMRFI